MGTGKSLVGRLLAEQLGREFVEMDALIEKSQGKTILQIFAEEGEVYFRSLEQELLRKLALKADLVVSCGGGLVCDPANLTLLKNSGLLICLTASPEVIEQRTEKHICRPLLKVNNRLKTIKELLEKRKFCYEQAEHQVNTDGLKPEEVAVKIKKILDE